MPEHMSRREFSLPPRPPDSVEALRPPTIKGRALPSPPPTVPDASAPPGSLHNLPDPGMGQENARLVERLRRVQEKTATVHSEVQAYSARLPAARSAVDVSAEELQLAQEDLEMFERIVAERAKRLDLVEVRGRELLDRVDDASFSAGNSAAQLVSSANAQLQLRLDELEEEHQTLMKWCEQTSHDACHRADQSHLMMLQDLERREFEASQCDRLLQDCGDRGKRLIDNNQKRIDRFDQDLAALREAQREQSFVVARAQQRLDEEHQAWRAERSHILRDVAHLDSHLAEVQAATGEAELAAEHAERSRHGLEQDARLAEARSAEFRASTSAAQERTARLAADVRELQERRRSMRQLLADEEAIVADLVRRAAPSGRRDLSAARRRSPSKRKVQSVGGLKGALSGLKEQQGLLESHLGAVVGKTC